MHIPGDGAFALYCQADVLYDGRAQSVLQSGNYLIIMKRDRSLLIHGGSLLKPCNYLGDGTTISREGNKLICKRKGELITIVIQQTIWCMPLENWTQTMPVISKTEKDLARKLVTNWNQYFHGNFQVVLTEVPTDVGPIDAMGVSDNNCKHVVEIKRGKATLKDCSQLRRYVEHVREGDDNEVFGYIASPRIGVNAHKYLAKHGLRWLHIDF